ncbi:extracellular solute-binding protein [Gammaproteobacteria bacterium]|nr:extracellular solute-binding protein [Gammaproteobacteria bacterium]
MKKPLKFKKINLSFIIMFGLLQSFNAFSQDRVVNFYNWADYIGEDTIENFQEEYGIKVNYDTYESSEIVEAKLLSGNSGYDLVMHSAMYSKRLMPIGIFHKIDKSKLKNVSLIDPKLMEMLNVFDPGNEMMIPYSYGSTGITYNEDMILERLPDAPIGSGAMLFDPEVISKFADCGISVLDSPTDVIPTALAYLGYRDDSLDPKELREVEDLLLEVRPYIKKFTSSTMLNDLPNGDLCMAQSWAGDYATAKMRSEEAGKKINLKYFVPSEGSLLWLDIMVIPNDAPNLENAYLLMDYLMRPEISADFVNLTHYASPIPSADKFLKDGVREDTAIYPTPEIMSLLTLTPVDPPKYNRIKTRIFTRFKTNQKRE